MSLSSSVPILLKKPVSLRVLWAGFMVLGWFGYCLVTDQGKVALVASAAALVISYGLTRKHYSPLLLVAAVLLLMPLSIVYPQYATWYYRSLASIFYIGLAVYWGQDE